MNRTGLSPADIAKSFRDRCGDGSVEWTYTPMQTWVLLDAADMLDENAELRKERDFYFNQVTENGERAQRAIDALNDKNAKLREFVADMWRFTCAACKKYPRLFDPAAQGGQMVQPNVIDSFEQRMRELGVDE